MLDFPEQLAAPPGIDAVVELRQQLLELRVRVAEVVVVARIDVVIHRLGVRHDAEIVVVAAEHLIEPLRPFQVLDVHRDAGLTELRRDDFTRTSRIAWRWQLQGDREAVGIPGLGEQRPRPGDIVRIDAG